jgi:hypothetical protein
MRFISLRARLQAINKDPYFRPHHIPPLGSCSDAQIISQKSMVDFVSWIARRDVEHALPSRAYIVVHPSVRPVRVDVGTDGEEVVDCSRSVEDDGAGVVDFEGDDGTWVGSVCKRTGGERGEDVLS